MAKYVYRAYDQKSGDALMKGYGTKGRAEVLAQHHSRQKARRKVCVFRFRVAGQRRLDPAYGKRRVSCWIDGDETG